MLLGFGVLSTHWFVDDSHGLTSAQGVLSSVECGSQRAGGDSLEAFAREQETGIAAPLPTWGCTRTFTPPLVAEIHHAGDVVLWLAMMLSILAGLASAGLAVRAVVGRGLGAAALTVGAAVALAAAVGLCALALASGEYGVGQLGYGAVGYVTGAIGALGCARWRARSVKV